MSDKSYRCEACTEGETFASENAAAAHENRHHDGAQTSWPDTFYVEVRGVEILGEELTYAAAVVLLNATCETWQSEGWTINRGWASSGNYAASKAVRGGREIFIAVEREES